MQPNEQQEFHDRCDLLDKVEILAFDSYIELLMGKSIAIVAMGGYNTFCEILSFDKAALIVPRSVPRQEQLIRAERAVKLGLVSMLDPAGERDVAQMVSALQALPTQPRPSTAEIAGLLAGHENIADMVRHYLEPSEQASVTA
jgi:predicted glycosyltransferase